MKVAVYGSLMKGLHNHPLLEKSKYIGIFETEPIYSLISLGSFPGLLENGKTSVVMEVYEINEDTLKSLDNLEGYLKNQEEHSYYLRRVINTPFGEAFVYIYNDEIENPRYILSGDWKEHKLELAQKC